MYRHDQYLEFRYCSHKAEQRCEIYTMASLIAFSASALPKISSTFTSLCSFCGIWEDSGLKGHTVLEHIAGQQQRQKTVSMCDTARVVQYKKGKG